MQGDRDQRNVDRGGDAHAGTDLDFAFNTGLGGRSVGVQAGRMKQK